MGSTLGFFFCPYAKKPNHKPPFFQGLFNVLQDPCFLVFLFFFFLVPPPPSFDLRWLGSSKLVSCGPECVTWLVSNRWIKGPNGGRRSPSRPLLRLLFFLASFLGLVLCEFEGIENRALAHQIRQQLQLQKL